MSSVRPKAITGGLCYSKREVGSWTAEAGERKSEKKAVGKKAKGKGKVKGR